MPANAANPVAPAPASRSVREFVAVFARHNLPYGELDCLGPMLRELHLNKHLAMHFWAAVASLTDKQAANPQSVAASIVEASTGRTPSEVRAAGPAYSTLVDRLERLLAGQDIAPEELPGLRSAAAPQRADTTEPVSHDGNEDVLPIRRPQETNRSRRNRQRASGESVFAPGSAAGESRRLVILPEPHRPALESTVEAAVPLRRSSAAPLSGYAETAPRGRGLAIGFLAILVILGAGAMVAVRHGGGGTMDRLGSSVRAGYDSAVSAWKGQPVVAPAMIVNGPLAQTATPPPATASTAAVTAPAIVPAVSSRPQSQSAPTAPASAAKRRSDPEALTPAQKMAIAAAYNEQRDSAEGSGPAEASAIPVSEAAMNAQLLVSRVPVIPDWLRETGATGVVRLQANINREGTVSHLRVLDGPTDLRRPAVEAVSAWRYRPYMINGNPVDVSTTITVDFSSLK
jgi:TonB family protein